MASFKNNFSSSSPQRNKSPTGSCNNKKKQDSQGNNKDRKPPNIVNAAEDEPPPLIGINNGDDDNDIESVADNNHPSSTGIYSSEINGDNQNVVAQNCSKSVLPAVDQPIEDQVFPCSDSASPRSRRRVSFSWKNSDTDDAREGMCQVDVIKEPCISSKGNSSGGEELPKLTPLLSAFHRKHAKNNNKCASVNDVGASEGTRLEFSKQTFSDSVLALPNLPEFKKEQGNDIVLGKQQRQEREYDANTDDEMGIARKTAKTNFVRYLQSKISSRKSITSYRGGSNSMMMTDDNDNFILRPLTNSKDKLHKHVSCLIQKDSSEIERLTKLMPRGREYVMFNVFTDFARIFYRKRRKHVAFPSEFLEKYQKQGDVAGKDRLVPVSKQPYTGIHPSKKRKLSAVYSTWSVKSSAFLPRVDRVEDLNKCELYCERCFISADCCQQPKGKPDLTTIMEGYWNDLNMASAFLHGHASRTFESAMSNLEFVVFHDCPSTIVAPARWSMNYSKQNLGLLSSSIWTFTYCVRTIIAQSREKDAGKNRSTIPSENSFRNIMEQFATMCVSMSENVKTILQYSHNFYNFCKECIRIMKVIQLLLGIKHELQLRPPLKRGAGLRLNRTLSKRAIIHQKGVEIKVAKAKPEGQEGELNGLQDWKKFTEMSGNEKATSLRSLLHITSAEITTVHTQLRFLMDDIVDSVKDVSEADLLYLLADMHDRVRALQSYGRKRTKEEIEQTVRATHEFCTDFQSFVNYGQHIMKRYVELRDMIHLSYDFMVTGLKLESLSEMVPDRTFKKQRGRMGCCGGRGSMDRRKSRVSLKRKVVDSHQPKYKVMDFFRVYYWDAVNARGEIYANKFTFFIDHGQQPITAIIPVGTELTWGEGDSPRNSFDEYAENEDDDMDDDIILGSTGDKDAIQIKPILVGSEINSPRLSLEEHAADDKTAGNTAAGETGSGSGSGTVSPPRKVGRGSADSDKI